MQLTEKSNLGSILARGRRDGARPRGQSWNLQQHHGLAQNQIPLDMLRLRPEERAVTPAPTNVETEQDTIVQPVFANSAGAFLGVYQPTVAMGDAVYPVLTSRSHGRRAAHRLDRRWRIHGRVRLRALGTRPDSGFVFLEANRRGSIREHGIGAPRLALNDDSLGEKADFEIINGSKGLLNATNLANHNVAAITNFQNYISEFAFGRVDGRYAVADMDVRCGRRLATYGHMGSVYQSDAASKRVGLAENQDGRRPRLGSRSGRLGQQAERRDSSRHASRHGAAALEFCLAWWWTR